MHRIRYVFTIFRKITQPPLRILFKSDTGIIGLMQKSYAYRRYTYPEHQTINTNQEPSNIALGFSHLLS